MKYCNFGFEHLYLDHYNGNVYICPWMEPKTSCIGNILEQDFDEIWFGEKAEMFRNKFRQNCFEDCRIEACPRLQNNDFPEIDDEEEYNKLTKTRYPNRVNLAYDFICNQSCETCRPDVFIPPADYKEKMDRIKEVIKPILEQAEIISMSGHGDPFASPYFMDMLSNLHPGNKNLKLMIETNGVFMDEDHWARIEHLKEFNIEVIVTVNSYDKFVYEHISRGGNYEKLMHNLEFIRDLRDKGYVNLFVISFVIQDRNFRELPSFIRHSLDYIKCDKVVLKPVYQWGTMPERVFWYKDVLNPLHPYNKEYLEILKLPELHDTRVYNFGGEMMHPAREYPVENKETPVDMKNEPSTSRKVIAHLATSLIPIKKLRRELRDKILCDKVK